MANTLITPDWTLKGVAAGFLNEIRFVANMDRTYDDQYVQAGAKVGYTVNARLPQRWEVTDGQAFQPQNIYNQTVPISLTNQKNIGFGWSSAQDTMEMEDVRERYVKPAAQHLANACDVLAYEAVYRDVYNSVGTPGTTPTSTLTYLQAGTKLTYGAVPAKGRVAVLDPTAMQAIANASATLFNPAATISGQYRDGVYSGRALRIDEWWEDPNASVHTTGSFTACSPTVNGASQTGASLITQAWASGATTLNKGDIFTVAGVYSVNPVSRVSTGQLQQFTVTTTISDTAGAITVAISPSIITSGQLQTVNASPANGAAITVWSANPSGGALTATASKQSMVYTKDAFAFVMADLEKPSAGALATSVRNKEFGVAIRMVEQYQILTDQNPSRLDILIGAATVQARFACRVVG